MEREHSWLKVLGKQLRRRAERKEDEQLPTRWVELIKHLNEQEKAQERAQNAERKRRGGPA
jgi:hypothetical protein